MRESDTPVPVEEDGEYVVDVEDIGDEGDGIAHVDDFVVLVPEGEMGDRVRVRIDRVEPEFATAELVEHESDVE
ncbi:MULTISPECIES: TRAM domain-containing protein [Halobacterium]|uniref:TRAM domain-containing protein n=1 Tax=Halobacterium TaxID=2239 RepID=UPI00073E5D5B|nr:MULTISPECIES: TRAM domain-containing protein [Halobacterium]MCG1004184.1 TRAM domain-containing protein [Halobacterium noricense]